MTLRTSTAIASVCRRPIREYSNKPSNNFFHMQCVGDDFFAELPSHLIQHLAVILQKPTRMALEGAQGGLEIMTGRIGEIFHFLSQTGPLSNIPQYGEQTGLPLIVNQARRHHGHNDLPPPRVHVTPIPLHMLILGDVLQQHIAFGRTDVQIRGIASNQLRRGIKLQYFPPRARIRLLE